MDWSRAKTILIIAFLVLNVVLAVQLYLLPMFDLSGRPVSPEVIKQLLEGKGVQLAVTLPRRGPTAPFALLSTPAYSDREITTIARDLLGGNAARIAPGGSLGAEAAVSYRGDGGQLVVVTARGLVSYENQKAAGGVSTFSAEEAARKAAVFVHERIGETGFVFEGVTPLESGGFRVDYLQRFRGSYVFPGYITLVVKSEGVVAMWMHRLRVSFEVGTARRILSAHEAVLSLVNHRQNAGETGDLAVQKMDFGFHSPIYDTVDPTWRGVPVWRIRTSRGEFFLNAHSGVLEAR
ncbi:MAG: hypothetical protein DDT39_01100 [Firmicutes bacterium]|nr:hypothetical protein [candidate division NPL-UPA2 bacterium]